MKTALTLTRRISKARLSIGLVLSLGLTLSMLILTGCGSITNVQSNITLTEHPAGQSFNFIGTPGFSDFHWLVIRNGTLYRESPAGGGNVDSSIIDNNVSSIYVLAGVSVNFYIKDDRSLWGWGVGALLGDGTRLDRDTPVHILDDVVWVGRGGSINPSTITMLAIKSDNTLWAWGTEPEMIAENVIRYLGATLVLRSDGTVFCYVRHEIFIDEPVYEMLPYVIDAGRWSSRHSQFLIVDQNRDLVLRHRGRNGRQGRQERVIIANDVESVYVVDTGFRSSTLFIKSDGSLWGWGNNQDGQLGDGTRVNRFDAPVKIAEDVIGVFRYGFLNSRNELWGWPQDNPTPQLLRSGVVQIGHSGPLRRYIVTASSVYYNVEPERGDVSGRSVIDLHGN